jgi:hypothetical protein
MHNWKHNILRMDSLSLTREGQYKQRTQANIQLHIKISKNHTNKLAVTGQVHELQLGKKNFST